MKIAISEKSINLENVEFQLEKTTSLVKILAEYYFCYSDEVIAQKPYYATLEYRKFSDLTHAIWDSLDDMQELLSIVQKNHEGRCRYE